MERSTLMLYRNLAVGDISIGGYKMLINVSCMFRRKFRASLFLKFVKTLLEFRILLGSSDSGGSLHPYIRWCIFRLVEIQDTSGSSFAVKRRVICKQHSQEQQQRTFLSQTGRPGALAVIQRRTMLGYFLRCRALEANA